MQTRHVLSITLAATIVAAAACGSSNTPATGPEAEGSATASSTAAATATAPPPPTATATAVATTPVPTATASSGPTVPATWKDASGKDQQMAYMKANVVPQMGPIFKGYDAKKYDKFGCVTCHGPDYKAPKDFLPHLTLKSGKGFQVAADKQPILKFMEKVAPAMASAMGDKPFDMATKTGFGCGGCHTVDMK